MKNKLVLQYMLSGMEFSNLTTAWREAKIKFKYNGGCYIPYPVLLSTFIFETQEEQTLASLLALDLKRFEIGDKNITWVSKYNSLFSYTVLCKLCNKKYEDKEISTRGTSSDNSVRPEDVIAEACKESGICTSCRKKFLLKNKVQNVNEFPEEERLRNNHLSATLIEAKSALENYTDILRKKYVGKVVYYDDKEYTISRIQRWSSSISATCYKTNHFKPWITTEECIDINLMALTVTDEVFEDRTKIINELDNVN